MSVREAMRSPYASISAPDGAELAASGKPPTPARLVTVPLTRHGEMLGALHLAPRAPGEEYDSRDRHLLGELASLAASSVEAVRLRERTTRLATDLQASRERLVAAREEERRRLRRDLHDGLGPMLAGQAMKIESVRDLVHDQPGRADAMLGDVLEGMVDAVAEVRRVAHDLRPPALDELGLAGAVRRLADGLAGNRLDIQIAVDDLPSLPAAVEVAAYYIIGEALTNVARHSGARSAIVALRTVGSELQVSVRDDGCGPGMATHAGVGTESMRERARELGGDCAVAAAPERGTLVSANLPCAGLGE
jgi:signal transduction histidine kinase